MARDAVPWEDRRLSFGEAAAEYDRWRPGYPEAAVRWVLGEAPARVADLGAGTGRLARVAAALGHDVVLIEPDPGMREVAGRSFPPAGPVGELAEGADPPPRVLDGSAEAIPLADRAVGGVLAGQAWHWFEPARAVPEIARVLRPGGVLGVLWNERDVREPWMATLSAIVDEGGEWSAGGGGMPAIEPGPPFGPAEAAVFDHAIPLRTADLPRLVATYSWIRRRPDREAVLARVVALAREHPDLAGREEAAVPYRCRAVRARRG